MIALRCFRDSQLADQLIAQQLRALRDLLHDRIHGVAFAVSGERGPFDGRILFPGLPGQSPCHDDGYVCVSLSASLVSQLWLSSNLQPRGMCFSLITCILHLCM